MTGFGFPKVSYHYCDSIGFKELPDFKKENPLRNAEMSTEDDYGMIDGILNNGKKQEEIAKAKKPSVLETLNSLKPEKGKEKTKHNRAEMEL